MFVTLKRITEWNVTVGEPSQMAETTINTDTVTRIEAKRGGVRFDVHLSDGRIIKLDPENANILKQKLNG